MFKPIYIYSPKVNQEKLQSADESIFIILMEFKFSNPKILKYNNIHTSKTKIYKLIITTSPYVS